MQIETLVKMANQIGAFFEAMPDHAEAVDGIADHLRKFWEPRMREALIAQIDDVATQQLHDIVREAVKANLAMLATKKVTPRN